MKQKKFNVGNPEFDPYKFLEHLFYVAVNASVPAAVIGDHMPQSPKGKTIIVGAGKASAQMAKAFEQHCKNNPDWDSALGGLVVTQYGAEENCEHIEIVGASHPVPDRSGLEAAKRMLQLVQDAKKDDLVVALISGGGSSLLPLPAKGMDLADKQKLNEALLACGAPISKMNAVRKMFSQVKGGRLGIAAHPAPLLSLVISDVPGDDPALVASGPTIADESSAKEAVQIIKQYSIDLSGGAKKVLLDKKNLPPKPTDQKFSKSSYQIISSAKLSLEAAAKEAKKSGCETIILSDAIEGEAREIGREHGKMIVEKIASGIGEKPLLILSGGETSVTIAKGQSYGKGGRNTEYLLALAIEISGIKNVLCLSADTDGRDGSEDNAGAFCDGKSLSRMASINIEAEKFIQKHDAWSAFKGVGDLLITGPTGTNVNDFRAALIWF